ncbi:MAG: helix-turn-helix domain-containing protein [Sedimentisphaerales bacterium]
MKNQNIQQKNPHKANNFAERFVLARKQSGLTGPQLAKKIGLSDATQIYRYESGKASPPLEMLAKFGEALNVDLHWLITGLPSPAEKKFREAQLDVLSRLARFIGMNLGDFIHEFKQASDALEGLLEQKRRGEDVDEDDIKFFEEEKARSIRYIAELQKDQPWVKDALEKLTMEPEIKPAKK